jgi:glycosyltransferase 2 family protein
MRRHLSLIVRIVVSVAILSYLAAKVNWPQLREIALTMDPRWLLAAFACFGVMLGLCAWRWKILLEVQDISIPFSQAYQLGLVGHFFNAFLLGVTGGDVVKIYYATLAAPEKKAAAGLSVIVDRIFGLVVLLIIAGFLCVAQFKFLTARADTTAAVYLTIAIATGTLVFCLLSFRFTAIRTLLNRYPWWQRLPIHNVLDNLIAAYDRYSRAWGADTACFLISVCNHTFGFLLAYCITLALHLDVPFWPFVSILPIWNLMVALPFSFGGIGVREGVAVIFFGMMGLAQEYAVTISVTFYGVTLLWSLIGSLFYLRYHTPQLEPGQTAHAAPVERT